MRRDGDGDDIDDRVQRRRRLPPADLMRAMLADVGIELDAPVPPAAVKARISDPQEPDRSVIREVLIAAGAPARDLEWMVASAPSVEAARTYRPFSTTSMSYHRDSE